MSIPCKMNPLGSGRGGERLPLGYKRLEYLENPGRQWIDTKVFPTKDTDFYIDFIIPAYESSGFKTVFSTYLSEGNYDIVYSRPEGQTPMLIRVPGGLQYGWFKWYPGQRYIVQKKGYELFLNGELKASQTALLEFEVLNSMTLLVERRATINNSSFNRTNLFSFVLKQKNTPLRNFIPSLDSSGRPCMFDTVTRRPFYNQGTGEFVAGMTAKQARHLAYLPATGGNLTISLPLAAAFDSKVQNALTTASGKNWVFTFYWTDVIEYLTPRIDAIVGEGNYTISFDYTAQKVSLAFALSVTNEQIDEVRTLFNSELLSNLVVEMQWANGLPIDYTNVEYLENVNGGDNNATQGYSASIRTNIYPTDKTRGRIVAEAVSVDSSNSVYYAFGSSSNVNATGFFSLFWVNRRQNTHASFSLNGTSTGSFGMQSGMPHTIEFGREVKLDGVVKHTFENVEEFVSPYRLMFLSETTAYVKNRCFRGKAYSFQLWEGDEPILNFIPALDPTGAPCMYDTVTREAYYSVTGYDFTYPGKETEATTYSLRNRMYAQLTPNGVRRLYRVPAGYDGSKEEYAAENGFKELVEPPMPLEGYWTPQWRETETQLILDWVETEPPEDMLAKEV